MNSTENSYLGEVLEQQARVDAELKRKVRNVASAPAPQRAGPIQAVAEGGREGDSGLGLKIVTVQLKEAVVSSTRLWENLQKPFRAEREKVGRMAELEAEAQLRTRELENRRTLEMGELEVARELEKARAVQERELYDRTHAELAELRSESARKHAERELATLAERRRIENEVSEGLLRSQLVAALPEVASRLPAPAELRTVSISPEVGGATGALAGLVASLLGVLDLGRRDGAPARATPPPRPAAGTGEPGPG